MVYLLKLWFSMAMLNNQMVSLKVWTVESPGRCHKNLRWNRLILDGSPAKDGAALTLPRRSLLEPLNQGGRVETRIKVYQTQLPFSSTFRISLLQRMHPEERKKERLLLKRSKELLKQTDQKVYPLSWDASCHLCRCPMNSFPNPPLMRYCKML